MPKKYILAIDQGTTGTKAIVVDRSGAIVSQGYEEIRCLYPHPGWVEVDPAQIWDSVQHTVRTAMATARISSDDLAAIGITNQRETVVIWDPLTGSPVYPGIVWSSRQSLSVVEDWDARWQAGRILPERTGLPLDAYFSASKIAWIFQYRPELRQRARRGELLFGNINTWLIWNLTGGAAHVTDSSNASRTLFYNIHDHVWDPMLLEKMEIPMEILPKIVPCDAEFGITAPGASCGAGIPIKGCIGDQQSALFAQGCYASGLGKSTNGTCINLAVNAGRSPIISKYGNICSVAWDLSGEFWYDLEGGAYVAGSVIQWLRDALGLVGGGPEADAMAARVPDNGGVVFVPAFTGLGSPYWDNYARGMIIGLTSATTKEHIVRAALESIAYQTRDVVEAMNKELGSKLSMLKVDGGVSKSDFLMEFLAGVLGMDIIRPVHGERTALGAAYMAGLSAGIWRNLDELSTLNQEAKVFHPSMAPEERERGWRIWLSAVARTRNWELVKGEDTADA